MPFAPSINVRLAMLQDTVAISTIHRSQVQSWRHLNWDGQPIAAYNDLSLYERWQHAGMHSSVELCAVHLHRLLGGSGTPLIAVFASDQSEGAESEPLAEAEVFESDEAAPFGHSLHIATLRVHAQYEGKGLDDALLDYIIRMAQVMACPQITLSGDSLLPFYQQHGFEITQTVSGVMVEAHSGRAVYQSTPLTDADPAQIRGWQMIFGREQASRVEWETLFPQRWAAGFPELADMKAIQTRLTVAGQTAIVFLQETPESGVCYMRCWSARMLTGPLLAALRDYVRREGFTSFRTLAGEASMPLLKMADAQLTEDRSITAALPISGGSLSR